MAAPMAGEGVIIRASLFSRALPRKSFGELTRASAAENRHDNSQEAGSAHCKDARPLLICNRRQFIITGVASQRTASRRLEDDALSIDFLRADGWADG